LAAFALSLRPDDYIFPYYRDRALMLARGITNYEMALAYFAKRSSSSGGRQMPGHYSDRARNVFSVCTPTAGGLLPACGAAWTMKLSGADSLALTTVGDASTRQGEFYEAVAYAVEQKLPLIIVVEDNKYGISTPTKEFLPFNLGIFNEDLIHKIDARHPEAVFDAGRDAAEKARSGEGPTVIWADLDRLSSHTSSDDHRVYRALSDIEEMTRRDPIRLLAEELIEARQLSEPTWAKMQEEIAKEVDEDYLRAERESDPDPRETLLYNFGAENPQQTPPIASNTRMTMVSAINQTFRKALESDP